MKTIGLLGGMSWESTAEYYRIANEVVRERLGGFHSAKLLIDSVDFADIEELQRADQWDAAGTLLSERAVALQDAGAELIVLCTNTMHLVAPAIESAITVPFLHIADATAAAVRDAGLRKVALLGTGFTMRMPFLRERLAAHGLTVLVPDEPDIQIVHQVIYDELVHGVITEDSRALYRGVMDRLVAEGAEGVILGCTEIELLITDADSPVPVFPTTRIHVVAAIDAALRGEAR
ncbi:MAG: aspartate/glutamate racemase family protein [Microbacterium sp.]